MKENMERLFNGKLKVIQEANKRTSLFIQNVNKTVQEANKRTSLSIQNVNKTVQEANKITSLSIQDVNKRIQEANKKTFLSIQNVNNQVHEANKKLNENKNYISLMQLPEFFPSGKIYPFCCFKNISRVLYLAYTRPYFSVFVDENG